MEAASGKVFCPPPPKPNTITKTGGGQRVLESTGICSVVCTYVCVLYIECIKLIYVLAGMGVSVEVERLTGYCTKVVGLLVPSSRGRRGGIFFCKNVKPGPFVISLSSINRYGRTKQTEHLLNKPTISMFPTTMVRHKQHFSCWFKFFFSPRSSN